MKTCISSYSYAQLLRKGTFTRFDAIDYTKKLGMDGIELVIQDVPDGYTFASYVKALCDHAREVGLEVPILTMGADFYTKDPDEELKRLMEQVDVASECGIPLMRHDITAKFRGDEAVKSPKVIIEAVAPYVRRLSEYAEEKGVKTCSENHVRIMQDADRIDEFLCAVNHKNYGLLCDMGNFGVADEECEVAVSRLIQHVCYVHAKDCFKKSGMAYNPGRGWNRSRGGYYRRATIFGHGDVPTFQILAALKGWGYNGWVSLEYEGIEDNLMALDIGSENLKRMIKDLEK